VVVLRDVGRFSADEIGPILRYLEDPLPTTVLVLVAGGGPIPSKLATAARAKGQVISTKVEGRQAGDWMQQRIRRSGVMLDGAAQALLKDHFGEDVERVVPLLSILEAVYGTGDRLGPDEIRPYLGEAGSVTPWTFTDAIDASDAPTALGLLHRLLEGGDRHPLVVLAILHRHIQGLMRVDSPGIRTEAEAAEAMGIAKGRSTYPAKKALRAARQWGSASIAEAIGLLADAEADLKGASGWPEVAVLEVLVARLCRLARAGPRAGAGSPRSPAGAGPAAGRRG
jgi:DNA polymerase-3 subunit delta